MQQAQDLQARLAKVQEEAGQRTAEGSAGGGMVKAVVNGRMELLELKIDPSIWEQGDRAMLADLIVAAVNQGLQSAQRQMADEMSKLTGGLKIPGIG
jgi:DNA-binding YbaB/EbfC family protein